MYKCKYFKIVELVPPEVYKSLGEDQCWALMDDRLLQSIDLLREKFGSAIINNWNTGGDRTQSGLRTDVATGAKYSQHRYGRAADMIFKSTTPAEVRQYILSHKDEFPYINAMENVEGWLHVDVRNCQRIMVFNP